MAMEDIMVAVRKVVMSELEQQNLVEELVIVDKDIVKRVVAVLAVLNKQVDMVVMDIWPGVWHMVAVVVELVMVLTVENQHLRELAV